MKSLEHHVRNNLNLLRYNEHYDPHRLLGLHRSSEGKVIRLWRPGVSELYLQVQGNTVRADMVDSSGLFELEVGKELQPADYMVYHHNGLLAHDPYSFYPFFGEMDQYLFTRGVHYKLHEKMGARFTEQHGVQGVSFTVWVPSAKRVSLVADFNHWDGRVNPMRSLGYCGVWEIFIPGLHKGVKYKFEIKTQGGELLIKSDPYALSAELRPSTASVVSDVDGYRWNDQKWIDERPRRQLSGNPLNIYEVHLGSWQRDGNNFLNYRELAHRLAAYCTEMGFTHVELMPVAEHPLDESWGYQITGYFAVTSRFGSPEDFQYFVDHLHQAGIGVILDWVPGHFPSDSHGLGRFDGTSLYEHDDPRQGWHPHWATHIFNYGRHEVSNFLLVNALFWFEKMHIDGLRVDAVASMLYLDYGRKEGEWIPNRYGGRDNLDAIEFLRHVNSIVHDRFPGVLMIAEESTSFPKITVPVDRGGMGFDYKWNMGWMNDTLRYISTDMLFRVHHHNDLTFGLLYAFSEKFISVLSHDEVVHGKCALLAKMPGDTWQQFANMRLLYSYMMCQPGKKLIFMGGELGQWDEWWCQQPIHWQLLNFPIHQELQRMVKEINHLYLEHAALWEKDHNFYGFTWVDFHDSKNSIISYLRHGVVETLFCIHNFTPQYHERYWLPLKGVSGISEIFNSDQHKYGGSGKSAVIHHHTHDGVEISIPPLATVIFKVER